MRFRWFWLGLLTYRLSLAVGRALHEYARDEWERAGENERLGFAGMAWQGYIEHLRVIAERDLPKSTTAATNGGTLRTARSTER